LINLGAPLTLLQLQEPYTKARYAGGGTCDFNCAQSLADQNARYIQLIRNAGWRVQILLEEAFPYNPIELLTFWDFQLMNHCASYGTQRPEYFEIDHDWRYQGGPWSWDDVGLLRDTIHGRGAQFGVIFWGAEDDNSHNDADWASDVNYQGFLYRVVHNIVPDIYSIESWLPFIPSQTVPESTPYTFMATAAAFRQNGYFPR
jgi:hypothetical protein